MQSVLCLPSRGLFGAIRSTTEGTICWLPVLSSSARYDHHGHAARPLPVRLPLAEKKACGAARRRGGWGPSVAADHPKAYP